MVKISCFIGNTKYDSYQFFSELGYVLFCSDLLKKDVFPDKKKMYTPVNNLPYKSGV